MAKGQRDKLKRAFEVYSRNPWKERSLHAVLKEVAINYPTAFLTCCGKAIGRAPASVFDEFDFSGLESKPSCSQSAKSCAPDKHAPAVAAVDLPSQAPEAPQITIETPKPAKPRPAKRAGSRASKTSAQVPQASQDAGPDHDPAKGPAKEVDGGPTEMTSVILEAFKPSSHYILSRALIQSTGLNESKVKTLLEGNLPVEVKSFCRPEHANNLRRALVRVVGTTVSLKTTPIATKK